MGKVYGDVLLLASYYPTTSAGRACFAQSVYCRAATGNCPRTHRASAECGNTCRRNCQGGTRVAGGLHRDRESRELPETEDTACAHREHLAPRLETRPVSHHGSCPSSRTTPQESGGLVQGGRDPLSE